MAQLSVLVMSGLLCSSLLVGCDSEDDVDAYGHERAAPTPDAMAAAAEKAVLESLEFNPDPSKFEYTGRIEDLGAPWRRKPTPGRSLTAVGGEEEGDDIDEEDTEHDPRADLVDILTRDGRTYRQVAGTQAVYTSLTTQLDPEDAVMGEGGGDDTEPSESISFRELITDNVDNRTRSTTADKQGVMVKIAAVSIGAGTTCSASMIAPRVFLTAAHCVTDDFGNLAWNSADWVMPSARGRSYSGGATVMDDDDTPWGARQVIRVVVPTAWDGSGAKYDYAMLIIGDEAPDNVGSVQWNPAPALVANQTCSQLLSNGVNLRGYPARIKTCTDASEADGTQCGGYAYTEFGSVDECTANKLFYYHDSQEGQSGSPVYRLNESTGKRRVVGVNRGTFGSRNYGHKIRAGSMSLICDTVEDPANQSSFFSNMHCE